MAGPGAGSHDRARDGTGTGKIMLLMPMKPFADRERTKRRFDGGSREAGGFSDRVFRAIGAVAAVMVFLAAFCLTPLEAAREESARLLFQKTASGDNTRVHVVRKGESIGTILRTQLRSERVSRALIRKLNPDIADLNRIFPGQRILLPLPGFLDSPESPSARSREITPPPVLYRVQEGDSISRILLSELHVDPAEALPAYRRIRRLNPHLPDLTQIRAGQMLHLPPAPAPEVPPAAAPSITLAGSPVAAAAPETAAPAPAPSPAATDPRVSAVRDDLRRIIRPVIARMQGTVTYSGEYFIPLQETTQITIDCAMIPIVELADGTTVLLDYGDRLTQNLKELIRQTWKNYAFVPAAELADGIGGLQAIFRRSKSYSMIRSDKPFSLSANPEILTFPEWIITGPKTGDRPSHQLLFLLAGDESPLPAEVRISLEKSGVVITEIAAGGVTSTPQAAGTPGNQMTVDLRGLQGAPLAQKLLEAIGETAVRNAEVVIFNQARNGFNLSITADLLVRKGDQKVIIHTKKLPGQFLQVLREANSSVIPIGDKDQGRSLIESVLQGLGLPVSFGYFTFRIPEEGKRPRFTASFSSLKAVREGIPFYLVDFDLPGAVQPFFGGRRAGIVIRY